MRGISLFSGVGGFELGFERAGIQTVLQVEIDPVARSVLERHWPRVARMNDVRDVTAIGAASVLERGTSGSGAAGDVAGGAVCPDPERLRESQRRACDGAGIRQDRLLDRHVRPIRSGGDGADAGTVRPGHRSRVLFGGFPCQDVSVAGRRGGLAAERSGLWREFRRLVPELRPEYVVVENVPGLYSSNERRDFAEIVSGLTSCGYGVAWRPIDAQFLIVPQRRRRVFFVAAIDSGDGSGAHRAAEVLALCEGCSRDSQARRRSGKAAARRSAVGAGVRGGQPGPVPLEAIPIQDTRGRKLQNGGGVAVAGSPAYTVDAVGDQAVFTFETRIARSGRGRPSSIASPLKAQNGRAGSGDGAPMVAMIAGAIGGPGSVGGFRTTDLDSNGGYVPAVLPGPVTAKFAKGSGGPAGDEAYNLVVAGGLRRLMPVECERLMGWPDDWTRWTAKGGEISDTNRYRLIGNGVVSTVAEWIGRRLVEVDRRYGGADAEVE